MPHASAPGIRICRETYGAGFPPRLINGLVRQDTILIWN